MTELRKDIGATFLTILAVIAFAATHEGWNVWLIGDSRRWAAGAILALGVATCALGQAPKEGASRLLAGLGLVALGLGIAAVATGSLTVLSFFLGDIVLLWALSTTEHLMHGSTLHPPLAR